MEPIQLFKQRDFGALVSDSFSLYFQNFKILGLAILAYAGPFLLLQGLATGMYTYEILKFSRAAVDESFSSNSLEMMLSMFGSVAWAVGLLLVGSILGVSALVGVINNFLKLYHEVGVENLTYQEIGAAAMRDLGKNIGASFLVTLVTILACLLLILPGIYVAIAFSLLYTIVKFENLSVTDALGRSLKLIKGHWWQTFGLLIVLGIMVSIVASIIQLPFTGIIGVAGLSGELPNYSLMLVTMGAITVVAGTLQGLIYLAAGVQYCSLTDINLGNSSESLIDEIGSDDFTNSPNNPF